jgi:hypothetical protein
MCGKLMIANRHLTAQVHLPVLTLRLLLTVLTQSEFLEAVRKI